MYALDDGNVYQVFGHIVTNDTHNPGQHAQVSGMVDIDCSAWSITYF